MTRRPRFRFAVKPPFAQHFIEGVERFNAAEFWHAHESWETLWLAAESDVDEFLQGLIQLAAAYHHLGRGNLRGAVRLFDTALRRLANFPPGYCGLDRQAVESDARDHQRVAASAIEHRISPEVLDPEEFPRLILTSSAGGLLPPHNECW